MKTTTTKAFYTPPPTTNYPPTTSELKLRTCQTDNFHIRRKLPSGDSPYVRAKHVQLIDKDPGKAVSLFWAAINSGDRVDSALKDMAVVMKQLDRSDEAIEAIKSFRSLCLPQSQDSLDNVLVELYKRSGRIEEEIEILQHKLKRIEEGVSFGGQRFKIVRSQGKRVQVTFEQETARILGNMAWAYLQLGEYKIAEEKYRQGLSLDPDKNMQCNLAYCLLQTYRIEEAKYLLDTVKCSSECMDESYLKSYERALSKLTELEQENSQMKVEESLTATPLKCPYPQTQWNAARPFQRRVNSDRRRQENRSFNGAASEYLHNGFREPCNYQFVGNSSPVILTQPRSPWRLTIPDQRKKLWNGRLVGNSSRKLFFEQPNIDNHDRTDGNPDGRKRTDWRTKALEALPHSDVIGRHMVDENQSGISIEDGDESVITDVYPSLSQQNETESLEFSDHEYHADADKNRKNNAGYQKPSAEPVMLLHLSKKSWADMVEEEELFSHLETLNNENLNPNLHSPDPGKMTQQMGTD